MPATYDSYLYHRAEVELDRARRATCPEAQRAHQELASRYLDRFYNPADTRRRDRASGEG